MNTISYRDFQTFKSGYLVYGGSTVAGPPWEVIQSPQIISTSYVASQVVPPKGAIPAKPPLPPMRIIEPKPLFKKPLLIIGLSIFLGLAATISWHLMSKRATIHENTQRSLIQAPP